MKRKLWLAGSVLLLTALALPFASASWVKQTLETSLQLALSRKVRIQGETRFRIFPTPAILADDVTISEDPAYSLEPFAYVTVLEVQPSVLALLSGRLEAARIRLTEPSVNLMRGPSGWNIQSIVSGNLRPPELEVRNGRLNFKQGNAKNAFYLTNALVDISAPTSQGDVKIFFSAEPARTDRGTQGFGKFSFRGEVHAPPGAVPDLDFDLELQPSSIHAFNFFFGARGVDFAGKLSGKGRLKGPWNKAAIEASLQFEGLAPQGFLPFIGKSNQLALAGSLDIPGQRFAHDTVGGESVHVRMRARDFFQSPKGALLLQLRDIELTKLIDLGREAQAKLPEGLTGKGKFNGVIGYAWPSKEEVPAKGMIHFADSSIEVPDQPGLMTPSATAVVEGSRWLLAPSEIRVGESQTANMSADWNARTGALQLDVATQLLSIKGLKSGLGLLLQASSLPLLSRAQGGSWQGNLHFDRTEDSDPGQWSGRLGVRN
ncbi:MAG: AsmA family protein, partial [Acidobacteria bacterium]|nr:AsmA family protein [Acidobacteriota bacterium]